MTGTNSHLMDIVSTPKLPNKIIAGKQIHFCQATTLWFSNICAWHPSQRLLLLTHWRCHRRVVRTVVLETGMSQRLFRSCTILQSPASVQLHKQSLLSYQMLKYCTRRITKYSLKVDPIDDRGVMPHACRQFLPSPQCGRACCRQDYLKTWKLKVESERRQENEPHF